MKKLILLFGLLFAFPAFAADNAVIVTPGVGVTMKSKDIGAGVQAMQPVLSDASGNVLSMPTAGADGVSNTATGLLGYSRNLVFNGTTWDRWLGDATNGGFVNVKTSVLPTGASTSANQTTINTSIGTTNTNLGAQADSAAAADNSTASLIALVKRTNQNISTLNTTAGGAVAAGTNLIGKTTPNDGTNSQVFDPCQIVATVRTPISISTAANIKIVTGTASKKTHICGMMLFSAGTTNVGIVEGSGTNCGTSPLGLIGGATAATGPNLTAQAGFVTPTAGYAIASTTVNANDICLINSAAIQVSGYIVTATP